MPSINDWAAKAAHRISREAFGLQKLPSEERIAAIIATFAEPLVALLREARRKHIPACLAYGNWQPPYEKCTCGADAWNARVDAALR